jgi:hypothetical protein
MNKVILNSGVMFCSLVLMSSFILASNLSEYPKPFITDGEWTGLIVIGYHSKVSDMIGAIDVAATIPTEVIVSDVQDEVTTSTNKIGETTSSMRTASDLPATLTSGLISNMVGDFTYEQKLDVLDSSTVRYIIDPDDDTDTPAFYLKVDRGAPAYLYRLSFLESLKLTHKTARSEDTSNYLEGIIDETITLLGKEYFVINAEHDSLNNIKLTLIDAIVQDTLVDGESKEYTINGETYNVSLSFIVSSDAVFSVNGKSTGEMKEGEIVKLSNGIIISVSEILSQNYYGGIRSTTFQLSSEKIELKDSNTTNHNFENSLKVNGDTIDQIKLNIKSTKDEGVSEDDNVRINAIEIRYNPSDDLYIPIGGTLSEVADRAESEEGNMFLNGFDIEFRSLTNTETVEEIRLKPNDDTGYNIEFTNKIGQEYDQTIMSCTTSSCSSIQWGVLDDSTFYDLVINESEFISDEEYFILSEGGSHIMKLKNIDTANNFVTVKDQAVNGNFYRFPYGNSSAGDNLGDLIVDGHIYTVNVTNSTAIRVDMNDNEAFNDTVNYLTTSLSARITLQTSENNISIRTGKLDGTSDREYVYAGVTYGSGNSELDIDDTYSTGYLYGFDAGTLRVGDTKVEEGYIEYGTSARWNYTNDQGDITWIYRKSQIFADTYIIGKEKIGNDTTTSTASLLGKNISMFDTEVVNKTERNLVLVGGPCANKLTAEVMGNPQPCNKDFEPGEAIIKLYENVFGGNKSALVIAGHSGEDTRNAAFVLKDYASYALSGKEIIVIDVNGNITVER